MQLSYRGRMTLYNATIFFACYIIIFFFVTQGVTYNAINASKNELAEKAKNTNIAIIEHIRMSTQSPSDTNSFVKNSDYYSKAISELEGCHVILYDNKGRRTADSLADSINTSLEREVQASIKSSAPVMTFKSGSNSTLYYVFPIKSESGILGYIGFLYPLVTLNSFLYTLVLFYSLGGLLGLIAVVIISLNLSNNLLRPIKYLTRIAREMSNGNFESNVNYYKNDEFGSLSNVINQIARNYKKTNRQLCSERDRLANIFAINGDGLLVLDENGNVLSFNSYIKTYFNISQPKSIYDFRFQSFLKDIYDALASGKKNIFEEVDVNDRFLLIVGSTIKGSSDENNYIIIIRNITASRQLENEQKKFISSISHELRTPLTTIIGYTDMLTRRKVVDETILNRSLSTINSEGHRLLRLVDDLININRFETAEFEIRKTNVNLQKLLNNIVEQMQIKASQNEIKITYKSELNLPEILGDHDRLQQVFINIIHNAIKYSNKGGIIEIISTKEDDNIIISIRDFGIGISELEKGKIFDAFYRVDEDRSRSEGEGGAGLGLYLVAQILRKHDGKIQVESIVGEGTNIIVILPILEKVIRSELDDEI